MLELRKQETQGAAVNYQTEEVDDENLDAVITIAN
jgi:hypothetical protein